MVCAESIRIAKIISDDAFTFTVGQLLTIHKELFDGIIDNAGELRTYNFTKKEWVLDGASVTYGDYRELSQTLQYDFNVEKNFDYSKLSMDEVINHLAIFISNLWQIHIFSEGNTRTTAVFFIKYLRKLGFDVTNNTFSKNAWYFRNSLVRANYSNLPKGIHEDRSFLVNFLRNLLLGENNELHNRELHIAKKNETLTFSLKESKVLLAIKENPKVSVDKIALLVGVSSRTVDNVLNALKNKKAIKRVNGKKYGYWEIL